MQNLYNDLEKLLKRDERLFAEGKILKNKVSELAIKLDTGLIELLFKDKNGKEHFFIEVAGKFVFNQDKFLKFTNNKEFLPNSFTAFKNHIGLAEGDDYLKDSGKVVLAWPYKDCVLEGGQDKEDVKRNEIFYNEILAPDEIDRLFEPKVLTNFKKIDKTGEHKVDQITEQDNLIIKGNNLLALHTLKKKYRGKVKLIYIDPPYNTNNSGFNYNDSFNHSSWLTFMKNRLKVAEELLKNDGIIFIQIDIRELSYLKVLCDEIFTRENFLSMITLKVKAGGGVGQESFLFDICEYILVYGKTADSDKNYKQFITADLSEDVKAIYSKVLINLGEDKKIKTIVGGNVGNIIVYQHNDFQVNNLKKTDQTDSIYYSNLDKIFRTTNPQGGLMKRVMPQIPNKGLVSIEYIPTKGRSAGQKIRCYFLDGALIVWLKDSAIKNVENKKIYKLIKNNNFWDENLHQGMASEGDVELKQGKKPEALIQKIIQIATKEKDLVLDYHLGSGTTAAVAHKMGRRYIGIEQLDYGDNDSVVRLKNVISGDRSGISKVENWKGGGSFVYAELKQWNENYMQAIREAKTAKELTSIYKKMQAEAFFRYEIDLSKFEEKQFIKLSLDDQKKVLLECLDKNHLYVNYNEMNDATYKIPAEEKKINKTFYGN